ncbi:MAG TPA: hypothetical protein VLK84_05405, partial [Longimicrobium sp.]|nr:hypothetical protein [Longimicrobium sp.]
RVAIERIALAEEDEPRDTELISAHAATEAERHVAEMYDDEDAAEETEHRRDAIRDFGGFATRRQLQKHMTERVRVDLAGPRHAFDYRIPTGSRVISPVYDREWAHGNGVAFGARVDGKVITIPDERGFSAAGIGVYLTVDQPVLAAITPQGSYDWNWNAFKNLPFGRSRGGLGITIFTDAQPQPTMSRQPVLWSLAGMTQFAGAKGSGRIADAASPAFGFGTVPLGPALLNMVPGSRYLVWVWCWQSSQLGPDSGFIAFLQMNMPFLTIDAGPPLAVA